MFRAKFERGSHVHRALAHAIFHPSITESCARLERDIFCPALTPDVFAAVMRRPKQDTNLALLKRTFADIADGKCTILTLENAIRMISDHEAPSVHRFLVQSQAEARRSAMYRSLNAEEHQMRQLDAARAMYVPKLPQHLKDLETSESDEPTTAAEEALPEEEAAAAVAPENRLIWTPKYMPPWDDPHYSIFYTVFYRVNGAHFLYQHLTRGDPVHELKIRRFMTAHLNLVRHIDSLQDPANEHIALHLYEPLGEAQYDGDPIRVEHTMHQMHDTPIQIIERAFPDLYWRPQQLLQLEDDDLRDAYMDGEWAPFGPAPPYETHRMYYAVVYVLNQIREHLEDQQLDGAIRDALWRYYCSWVPLIECCVKHGRADDAFIMQPLGSRVSERDGSFISSERMSPWQMHGFMDTRAFHAGDLPDFLPVLLDIPLWGETYTPSYLIGKLYQKSLPFACMRRHIIRCVMNILEKAPAFWSILSKLTWVMLANLYPGDMFCTEALHTMRHLCRIKELCDNRERLMTALQQRSEDSKGGGPLVMYSIIRMHILFMAEHSKDLYVEQAQQCIDWNAFKQDVIKLANMIRTQSLYAEDAFGTARKLLSKTVKSPQARVHRMRKHSRGVFIADYFNEVFEKHFLKDKQNFARTLDVIVKELDPGMPAALLHEKFAKTWLGRHMNEKLGYKHFEWKHIQEAEAVCRRAEAKYKHMLHIDCKAAILNLMIRMPAEHRLSKDAFCTLMLPEYGGASSRCVATLCDLVTVYQTTPLPREYRQRIDVMDTHDFLIACFYMNTIALLEKISFFPLDHSTVERTHHAMMTKKYRLLPNQRVLDSVYDVYVSLCCEKIWTLTGPGNHGNKKISYDTNRHMFVCIHGRSLKKRRKQEDEEAAAAAAAAAAAEKEKDEDDDDDELDDDELEDEDDDDDDDEEINHAEAMMEEQEQAREIDFDLDDFSDTRIAEQLYFSSTNNDLASDATKAKGKGSARDLETRLRKQVRNERKAFYKVPCGQPVLKISLKGRALVWGNTLQKRRMYMFCPSCGSFHQYTMLNFSGSLTGEYRCNDCARDELMHVEHRTCEYCENTLSKHDEAAALNPISVLCPNHAQPEQTLQRILLCRKHHRIALKYLAMRGALTKDDLWVLIKRAAAREMQKNAQ